MKFQIRSRTWLMLGTVLMLGACSAIKLGYNNSATFAHTYLTSKVDFDSDQSALMKSSLRGLVEWHRNNELPLLAEELQKARLVLAPRGENLQPVTAAQVNALNQAIRTSLRRTADEAAPVIAKNMLGLWPNQISDIQEALNKSNQDYREKRMASNPGEREKCVAPADLPRSDQEAVQRGMVGEAFNKLAAYLAIVSRKLASPLAILVQSSRVTSVSCTSQKMARKLSSESYR